MAINTIQAATFFQQKLDEVAVQSATTDWMDSNAGQVIYNGGDEVKIPKMSVQGLGNYDRDLGYVQGSVTLNYETRKMTQDRGRKFQLDAMTVDNIANIAEAGATAAEVISENWGLILTVLMSVASAFAIYYGWQMIIKAADVIITGVKTALATASYLHAVAVGTETSATAAATAAQYGLNTALLACPLTLVVIAIIAVVTAIYAAVGAFNKMSGTSISATGIIIGSFATVGVFIYNLCLGLLDVVTGLVNFWVNMFVDFANFFGNVLNDPVSSIIHLFGDLANNVLGVIEKIANAIDKVFGSNLTASVSGWRSGLSDLTNYVAKKYGGDGYKKLYDEFDTGLNFNSINYDDAFNGITDPTNLIGMEGKTIKLP